MCFKSSETNNHLLLHCKVNGKFRTDYLAFLRRIGCVFDFRAFLSLILGVLEEEKRIRHCGMLRCLQCCGVFGLKEMLECLSINFPRLTFFLILMFLYHPFGFLLMIFIRGCPSLIYKEAGRFCCFRSLAGSLFSVLSLSWEDLLSSSFLCIFFLYCNLFFSSIKSFSFYKKKIYKEFYHTCLKIYTYKCSFIMIGPLNRELWPFLVL